jgi:hypothetical protein
MNRFFSILILVAATVCASHVRSQETADSVAVQKLSFDEAFVDALKCIKMTPEDLKFRDDYVDVDSFRLELIDRLMRKPMETKSFNSRFLSDWTDASAQERRLGLPSLTAGHLKMRGKPTPSFEDRFVSQNLDLENNEFIREYGKSLKKLPKALRASLTYLFLGMRAANSKVKRAFVELSDDQKSFLRENFPLILLEDVEDEFKTPEELDEQGDYEEELAERMVPYLSRIKVDKIVEAGDELSSAARICVPLLAEYTRDTPEVKPVVKDKKDKENDLIYRQTTSLGEVMIGGYGSSRYTGSPAIIIDLGGDDEYGLTAGESEDLGSSVIIDLGGNDAYRAKGDFVYGSGFCGVGILVDLAGNDAYLTNNFSLGSGLFGVGVFVDEKGNDTYIGDTFGMGAGSFGMGFLVDMEGSDQYSGALFVQGFAFVAGLGALIDSSGNDNYFAGGRYKDILRYEDHYISLSQGFAYGLRPMMSGGIGILFDLSGNDVYTSDIFGQGSSYWFSLGTLMDREGNDKYVSFQYAQGAGTHLCLGILEDEKGDDVYISHGVSQGCGHDLALGILWDKDGNDNYLAESLSQGAGSANGFGIMIDEGGDDGYYVSMNANTQGYGNPRRDYGSVGMLLDFSGKDLYRGNGADSTWWTTPSKWGIGVDR